MESHRLNDISFLIIQAAIEVHRTLGPGLLESVYRACMIYELRQRNLTVVAEQIVPICYKDVIIDGEGGYRLDLLVENDVLVEIRRWKYYYRCIKLSFYRICDSQRNRSGYLLTLTSRCSLKVSSA